MDELSLAGSCVFACVEHALRPIFGHDAAIAFFGDIVGIRPPPDTAGNVELANGGDMPELLDRDPDDESDRE